MKNIKMLICLIMCMCLLVPVLVACDNTETTSNESADGTTSGDVGEFPYADKSFNDAVVKIFCVNSQRHVYGELQFVPNSDDSGSQINDAVSERNDFIKEKYGVSIEVYAESYPTDTIKMLVESNSCEYDIVVDSVDRMVTKISDNIFWSVDDIVNLDDPWWDRSAIDALTFSDKHYFLCGDALITDDDNTYLTLFNKDMYNDNADIQAKYGNIYDLVRNKEFTIDAFTEMARMVSAPDADGNWSPEATYGNLSHAYGATIMFNGSGEALAVKSTDGVEVNVVNTRPVSVFDKVYELMSNTQITTRAELLAGKVTGCAPSTYGFGELEYLFVNGRGLFYNTTSSSISILKKSTAQRNFEFGVLPIPLYEKGQEQYHCAVNRYQSSVMAIPTTNRSNLDATAFLLNALGYYSRPVTEAYYKITLQLQAVDDDDDAEMLDIIYDSRFYDLGAIFTWGNLAGLQGAVIANSNSNTLMSSWDAMSGTVESEIQKTLDDYNKSLT